MDKIFWIVCGLVLVAAIALRLTATQSVLAEAKKLEEDVRGMQGKLDHWYGPKGRSEIVNPRFVAEANEYKGKLDEEQKKLLALLQERNLDLSEKSWIEQPSDEPPPTDGAQFRRWLTERYRRRDAAMAEAGVAVAAPKARGDVTDWDSVVRGDMPRILQEFAISLEVHKAAREAKARTKAAGNGSELECRIAQLASLDFGGPVTERGLFKEREFGLVVVAHYGVVCDLIRRLERSQRGFFVTKSVKMVRLQREDKMPAAYENTEDQEAPIRATIAVARIEFTGGGK